jgi:hypothetical protein
MPKGEVCSLGIKANGKMFFTRYSADNRQIIHKQMALAEMPERITRPVAGGQNQLITVFSHGYYSTLNWINTTTGEITATVKIPDGLDIREIMTDRNNNLLLVACNHEIIVIRNNTINF